MENARTQIGDNVVQNYITLTKHYIRVLHHIKPEHKTYPDVIKDFKQEIAKLKGAEMEQYILTMLKKYPEDLGKIIDFFPVISLLIRTINKNIAKNIKHA